jgi:hypothetical protein
MLFVCDFNAGFAQTSNSIPSPNKGGFPAFATFATNPKFADFLFHGAPLMFGLPQPKLNQAVSPDHRKIRGVHRSTNRRILFPSRCGRLETETEGDAVDSTVILKLGKVPVDFLEPILPHLALFAV